MFKKTGVFTALCSLILICFNHTGFAQTAEHDSSTVIVKFNEDVGITDINSLMGTFNATFVDSFPMINAMQWQLNDDSEVEYVVNQLNQNSNVQYCEPNFIVSIDGISNDPQFSELWGLHNIGQSSGKIDADIDAPEAWDIQTGTDIIVGVIDTGVDYTHPDLVDNMWANPGEIPNNGVDDDNNGYIDDYYGWDFYNNDNDPFDDHFHGTHCAGTIAAVGNNGVGIAGVSWSARIMPIKFLSSGGYGYLDHALKAVEYAIIMDADLTSNSWGGGGYSQALYDMIEKASENNQLFIAAAGNSYSNNDLYPAYPASYNLDNIISVAATDRNDLKADFSNYGANSVDLGAPGVSIYSTMPNNNYGSLNGTSMAAPHVSGAVSLILSQFPNLEYTQVKQRILDNVDPIESMEGITVSGGRLNVYNTLSFDCTSVVDIPVNECEALVDFYNQTDGDNWTDNSNWLESSLANDWYGIAVENGHVTEINMAHNFGLNGELPDINLPELTILNLEYCAIENEIPDFTYIDKLTRLKLGNTNVSGPIPDFHNLPTLEELTISSPYLDGSVPNFNYMPVLRHLALANISSNDAVQLSGPLPDFGNLPNLERLMIRNTQLSGPLPNYNLPNLEWLQLDSNDLSGEIPDFDNLSNLTILSLNGNNFNGTIPAFSHLSNLISFSFGANQIMDLPDLLHLENLTYLSFRWNNLSEDDCANVQKLINRGGWDSFVHSPQRDGFNYMESCFEVCENVTDISQNECEALVNFYYATGGDNWTTNTGWLEDTTVGNWFGVEVDQGVVIALQMTTDVQTGNNLIGTIPDLNLPYLRTLNLSYNQLSGSIPDFSNLGSLTHINLRNNQLEGSIPDFSNLPNLTFLEFSFNVLTGSIPDFANLPDLYYLNVGYNQLSGSLPDFSNLAKLVFLYPFRNQLTGRIPDFSNLGNLCAFHVYFNQLTGPVPTFNNCPNLCSFSAGVNQLSGNIPNFDLPNLTHLHLSSNELTGPIPYLNNCPNLIQLYLNDNHLSGNIPDFNLPDLVELYLYSNELTGPIPDFSNLPNLVELYLYENQLTGPVPAELCNLTQLTDIRLCNNELSCPYPPCIVEIVEQNGGCLDECPPNSDILVWEGNPTQPDYSGLFIRDYLQGQGYTVDYRAEAANFPADLSEYEAVFLSYGNYTNGHTPFDDNMANVVLTYLENGGKLYLEGGDPLGWDQYGNVELYQLFGLDGVDDRNIAHDVYNDIDLLEGQAGTLTQGLMFYGSNQRDFDWIDLFYPSTSAVAFFESDYGEVAVQNVGDYAQRTFVFSYALAGLTDGGSTREELLQRIVDFFFMTGPDIFIYPTAFEWTVPTNFSQTDVLNISNWGTENLLINDINANAAWLEYEPTAGTVAPSDALTVTLNVNSSGLAPGVYTTEILVNSNDPDHPSLSVPVSFTISNNFLYWFLPVTTPQGDIHLLRYNNYDLYQPPTIWFISNPSNPGQYDDFDPNLYAYDEDLSHIKIVWSRKLTPESAAVLYYRETFNSGLTWSGPDPLDLGGQREGSDGDYKFEFSPDGHNAIFSRIDDSGIARICLLDFSNTTTIQLDLGELNNRSLDNLCYIPAPSVGTLISAYCPEDGVRYLIDASDPYHCTVLGTLALDLDGSGTRSINQMQIVDIDVGVEAEHLIGWGYHDGQKIAFTCSSSLSFDRDGHFFFTDYNIIPETINPIQCRAFGSRFMHFVDVTQNDDGDMIQTIFVVDSESGTNEAFPANFSNDDDLNQGGGSFNGGSGTVPEAIFEILDIDQVDAAPGQTVRVPVALENDAIVTAADLVITLEQEVTTIQPTYDLYLTDRTEGFTFSVTPGQNELHVHLTGGEIEPGDGPIMELEFEVESNAAIQSFLVLNLQTASLTGESNESLNVGYTDQGRIEVVETPDDCTAPWPAPQLSPVQMTVYGTPYFENIPLNVGDWIGAFDGDYCAGMSPVNSQGNYFLVVNGATGDTPGFSSGERMSFRIYRCNEATEHTYVITLGPDEPIFNAGGTVNVDLNGSGVREINIPLSTGWNLISFNVTPENPSVTAVLASILDALLEVRSSTQVYLHQIGQGTLTTMNPYQGYWVKVSSPVTLTITGVPVPPETPIDLIIGWNLISYLPEVSYSPQDALYSILSYLLEVRSSTQAYIHAIGQGSLTQMAEGNGYWVKVSQNCVLTYPAAAKNAGALLVSPVSDGLTLETIWNNPVVTPQSCVFYGTVSLADNWAVAGDQIGAFMGNTCIGQATVMENGRYALMVFGAEGDLPGAADGDQVELRIYQPTTGREFTGSEIHLSATPIWSALGSQELNVRAENEETISQFTRVQLSQNYPNPFNPMTEIAYQIPVTTHVQLNVYSIDGRLVKELVNTSQEPGFYQESWDGSDENGQAVTSGTYMYQLRVNDEVITKKMVLLK